MRHTWIVFLTLPLIVWGCKDKAPTAPTAGPPQVMRQVSGPLSPEDTQAAFQALGLQVERFDCFLPRAGKLHLFVRRYVEGQLAATPGKSALGLQAGNQHFLLFTHKQDSSLSFTFTNAGASTSCGQIDISGYRASTWRALSPVTLTPGQEVPFYIYAASNGDLAAPSSASAEQLIAQYPLAIVVCAEWLPNEGP